MTILEYSSQDESALFCYTRTMFGTRQSYKQYFTGLYAESVSKTHAKDHGRYYSIEQAHHNSNGFLANKQPEYICQRQLKLQFHSLFVCLLVAIVCYSTHPQLGIFVIPYEYHVIVFLGMKSQQ